MRRPDHSSRVVPVTGAILGAFLIALAVVLAGASDGATASWIVWLVFLGLAVASFIALGLALRLAQRGRALERAAADLAESKLQIALATEAKTRFLASMSHELRTPLNGVIGFAELMYDGRVGAMSPQHREYMGDILTSARHLLQLINEVLDISKVESGQVRLAPEAVDLGQLVTAAVDGQRPVAERAGLTLTAEIEPEARQAVVDPARFTQVLLNFVSNALKFTPSGGSVVVRLAREDAGSVRFEVEDDGPGISPEDRERVFVEFAQLRRTPSRKGTGLGLALSKRIVEAQGGKVGVVSSPGEGSRFFAVLPSNQAPAGDRGPGAEGRVMAEASA